MMLDEPAHSGRTSERGSHLSTNPGMVDRQGQPGSPPRSGLLREAVEHTRSTAPQDYARHPVRKPHSGRRHGFASIVQECGDQHVLIAFTHGHQPLIDAEEVSLIVRWELPERSGLALRENCGDHRVKVSRQRHGAECGNALAQA